MNFDNAKEFQDMSSDFFSGFGPAGKKAGEVPTAGPAKSKLELANWFVDFARACRANLPKESLSK